jgi:hypothetical protein
MSNRARYETKDGEHLRISRGTLTIRSGETGSVEERTISGTVMYDRTSRKLHVPVQVIEVHKETKVRSIVQSTIIFDIAKDPGQLRKESRGAFVEAETSRLVNRVRSLPATLGADPSGMGGSPNPAHDEARAVLGEFCKRYGLDFHKVLGYKGPDTSEAPSEKPRRKAKERRAEESVS